MSGVYDHGGRKEEEEERLRKAAEAEQMIASGKVRVNPKNHVVRKGGKADAEDREVSSALDELDALDKMFDGVLK